MPNTENQPVVSAVEGLKSALYQFTIPFYTKQNGKVFVAGTGVLIAIGDMHFVVTSAHMFDAIEAARLALCVQSGPEGRTLLPFDKVKYHRPGTHVPVDRTDEPFDFCVCELPPTVFGPVSECKRFLRLDQIEPFDSRDSDAWYVVLGFPGEINPTDMTNRQVKADALVCCSHPYGDEFGAVAGYDPRIHFQMVYNKNLCTDGSGVPISLPHPSGMSGCGMWRLVKAGSDQPSWKSDDVRLMAIQHSVHPQRVIRGTLIKYALHLIWKQHPSLDSTFEMHFGRQWRESF